MDIFFILHVLTSIAAVLVVATKLKSVFWKCVLIGFIILSFILPFGYAIPIVIGLLVMQWDNLPITK